jgi:hypothetical protein
MCGFPEGGPCCHVARRQPRQVERHEAFRVVTPDVSAADKLSATNLSNCIA